MPDEVDGQEPTQEPAADEAQEEAAAADLAPDVEPDGEPDAGTEAAPESIDALLERYPSLREQHQQSQAERDREREIAGANRERARLQRDAGKADQTRVNVGRFLAEQGVEVDDPSRLNYFYELAQANAAYELATSLPDAVLRGYPVPVEAREAAVEARERGDWDGYVTHLVTGAVEAKDREREAAFEKRVNTETQKRLAAEIKTRGLEKAPVREGAPTRPGGGQSGQSGPTVEQYRTATRAQREAWRREGVNPVLA